MAYDPKVVGYERLLELFWSLHDPTTPNRQGPNVGDQYRSAVFYHTPEQKEAALKVRDQLQNSGEFRRPIVTEIAPAAEFWRGEDYHQQFEEKRGLAGCRIR